MVPVMRGFSTMMCERDKADTSGQTVERYGTHRELCRKGGGAHFLPARMWWVLLVRGIES
jgi:hypothetical protein